MKRRFFHFAGILAMTVMIQGLAEAQVRKAKSKPAVKAPVIRQQKDRGSAVPATQAGTGGPAIAIGGNGGKGSVLGKGGSGGNAIAVGGKGGDVLGDRGTAGKGGSALAIGGRGGDAQGGVGGRGGDAIAFGGNGGNVLSRTPLLGDRSNRSDSKNADSKSAGTTLINTGTINNTAGNGGNATGAGSKGGRGGDAKIVAGDSRSGQSSTTITFHTAPPCYALEKSRFPWSGFASAGFREWWRARSITWAAASVSRA